MVNDAGTSINKINRASKIKPPRQPKDLITSATSGLNIVPPIPDKPKAIPITVPNLALNHFCSNTGIDRIKAPG